MRNLPLTPSATRRARAHASSSPSSSRLASAASDCPASVSSTRRVVRRNSVTPTSRSRSRIWALTAGCALLGACVHYEARPPAPEKFAALVSVDGLLCRLPGTPEELRGLAAGFASPDYLEHAKRFISSLFPVPGTEALRARVMAEMLVTPQHVMLGAMLAMVGPDQPDWILPPVSMPVLILNSRSPWWNSRYENYVRSLSPQSEYITIEGVGHFIMLEQPAAFNATLANRLEKHGLIGK